MSLLRNTNQFELEVLSEFVKASTKINDLKLTLITRRQNLSAILFGGDDESFSDICVTNGDDEKVFCTITQGDTASVPIYLAGPWEDALLTHADNGITGS